MNHVTKMLLLVEEKVEWLHCDTEHYHAMLTFCLLFVLSDLSKMYEYKNYKTEF